jgi:S1-C subfamily serine protease
MKTMVRAGVAAVLLAVGLPLAADHHEPAGILVTAVDPDGPAAAAGIERGDLILSIDGESVASGRDLTGVLGATEASQVSLTVKHGDEVRDRVVLIDRVWGRPRLGMMILGTASRHDDFERRGRMPEGRVLRFDQMPAMPGAMVMEVVEDSPAAGAGLQPGDWITAVDGAELGDSSGHLAEIISGHQPGDSISLDYQRDGEAMAASVTLGTHPDTGTALLGVRYRTLPWFGAGDRDDMRELFDMLQERFERQQRSQPAPDIDEPDSNQAL